MKAKTFSDEGQLREFVTRKPLYKMLKKVLQMKGNDIRGNIGSSEMDQ